MNYNRKHIWRITMVILRVLFGALFIFSGIAKAVDPWGSAYKFQEYFHAAHIFWMDGCTLFLGIILPAIEFITGFCLLVGSRVRLFSRIGFLFMLFFTSLTFILLIFNPVTDCGCFGDAIKLTNAETFGKNVVLLIIAILLIKQPKTTTTLAVRKIPVWLASIFILGVSCFSYFYLPIIDFRPYKIGTNIEEGMSVPPGSAVDKYKSTFIYEKDGKKEEFTVDKIPKPTDGWTFVDQKSVLLQKGYEPPIHDFQIEHPNQGDITDLITESKGYAFFILAKKLEEADRSSLDNLKKLYTYTQKNNLPFIAVSASDDNTVNNITQAQNIPYTLCSMDETTIKTIIRSNPGVLLIKDGIIINKWGYRSFPNDWSLAIKQDAHPHRRSEIMFMLLIILITGCLLLHLGKKDRTKY